MKPLLAQHPFAAVEPRELKLLKLGDTLLPGLLGSTDNLLYESNTKNDRIIKAHFKSYLTISFNLKTLIETEKDIKYSASQTNSLIKTKVALALQNGVQGKTIITAIEHSKILRAQASFQNSAVEVVRRELASYEVEINHHLLSALWISW